VVSWRRNGAENPDVNPEKLARAASMELDQPHIINILHLKRCKLEEIAL
jgi:hypothetical protein